MNDVGWYTKKACRSASGDRLRFEFAITLDGDLVHTVINDKSEKEAIYDRDLFIAELKAKIKIAEVNSTNVKNVCKETPIELCNRINETQNIKDKLSIAYHSIYSLHKGLIELKESVMAGQFAIREIEKYINKNKEYYENS